MKKRERGRKGNDIINYKALTSFCQVGLFLIIIFRSVRKWNLSPPLCVLKIKDNDISLTVAFPASEDNPEEIVRYIVSDDNFDNCITGGFELTDEEKITLLISLFKKLA